MAETNIIPAEIIDSAIETVDDAIGEIAYLAAISTVVDERTKAIKAWAGAKLGRAGASREVDGVGKALVTDPQTVPKIVDGEAFLAWALETHPDRTATVDRVVPGAIQGALAGDLGDDLADRLAEILDEIPGAVVTEVVTEEKLPADLAKPKVSRELEDGRLVDKETGEIIPGLELRAASQPAPRVTPDRDLVANLAGTIRERLIPVPSLEPAEEDADA